jgi:hypothetical protein
MRAQIVPERRMNKTRNRGPVCAIALAAIVSLGAALGLSSCTNVAGFSQPSLVRVIDASFIAPAVNIYVANTLFAGNVGEGYISNYGTIRPSPAAVIKVAQANGGATLVTAAATLNAGAQHSVFITDNGASPTAYRVTVLEDQQTPAAAGHSAFRFLNQAPRTGPVDVYMVPGATTLANTIPICTNLPVGSTCGYVGFASQSVTMVITPTGTITPKFTSTALGLTGGEVRTIVIVDSQLTSDPPVQVVIAKDVG